jgi:sec-independent protein translocase protein TatA
MNIAGVGPAELLLILIVALLVFGPQKLPEIARDVGKSIGKWRQALEEIESVAEAPMKEVKEMKEALDPASMEKKIQESVQKIVAPESQDDKPADQKAIGEDAAEDKERPENEEKPENEEVAK